jgi:hypothetical protein
MRTRSIVVSVLLAAASAGGTDAAEWPRIVGQGSDWVRSMSEPQWPNVAAQVANQVAADVERRHPSPFAFEVGSRYWYSTGTVKYGFTNNAWPFGSPTSTLDWNNVQGHSGELFARIDHRPTGLFVKGMAGAGVLRGGEFVDRDYFIYQIKFSDTTSQVDGDTLKYATFDVGMSYELPRHGIRLGGFVGYHYWNEKMSAYGGVCNGTDIVWVGVTCGPPGSQLAPSDLLVLVYQPTWHAFRVGVDGRFRIDQRWSVSGEIALVPIAWIDNKDSHVLRQSPADFGPAPNVISNGYGYGGMAEAFINYAITPNIEAGVGARYWGINAYKGSVNNGPDFNQNMQLDFFNQNRYGVLVHLKGRF